MEESWERWPERGGAAAARTRTPRREEEESEPFKTLDDGTTNDAEDADDNDDFTSEHCQAP